MRKCDLCQTKTDYLLDIDKEYRDKGFEDICSKCNESVSKIMGNMNNKINRFSWRIRNRLWDNIKKIVKRGEW